MDVSDDDRKFSRQLSRFGGTEGRREYQGWRGKGSKVTSKGRGRINYKDNRARNNGGRGQCGRGNTHKPQHRGRGGVPPFVAMCKKRELRHQHDMRKFVLSMLAESEKEKCDVVIDDIESSKKERNRFAKEHLDSILSSEFSIDAGDRRNQVSFQRVIVPLAKFLTQDCFFNSPLSTKVKRIWERLGNHQTFLRGVATCLVQLAENREIADKRNDATIEMGKNSTWEPTEWDHILTPMVSLIRKVISEHRFRQQKSRIEMAKEVVKKVRLAGRTWESKRERTKRDIVHLGVIIRGLDPEEKNTVRPVRRSRRNIQNRAERTEDGWPGSNFVPTVENPSRHDNDKAEYREISILPTKDELNSAVFPYLPSRGLGSAHLKHDPLERYLDIQFRLMREDGLACIRNGIQALCNKEAFRSITFSRHDATGLRTRLKTIGNNNSSDSIGVVIYRNVKAMQIEACRKGIGLRVGFTPPTFLGLQKEAKEDSVPLDKSDEKRKEEKKNETKPLTREEKRLRALSTSREQWWDFGLGSKHLQTDSVVCLLINCHPNRGPKHIISCTIIQRRPASMAGLYHCEILLSPLRGEEMMTMVSTLTQMDIKEDLRGVGQKIQPGENVMVQISGSFFPAYEPILTSLQKISGNDLPDFVGSLVQAAGLDEEKKMGLDTSMDLPQYLVDFPDMKFDLRHIIKDEKEDIEDPDRQRDFENARRDLKSVEISSYEKVQGLLRPLADKDMLIVDPTQADALAASLTSQVSLIQGPPGTGKTYIGVEIVRTLLKNSPGLKPVDWEQGVEGPDPEGKVLYPVLCICYTNHALDQFLEHLLEKKIVGINEVIRIGGRSKLDILKNRNLFHIRGAWTRDDNRMYAPLRHEANDIEKTLKDFWKIAHNFLEFVETCDDQFLIDIGFLEENDSDELWTTVHKKKESIEDRFQNKLMRAMFLSRYERNALRVGMTPVQISEDFSGDALEIRKRYNEMVNMFKEARDTEFKRNIDRYRDIKTQLEEVSYRSKLSELRESKIIGVTTSGAAKYHSLITAIRAKVIICEEAGEVFESHILTALSNSTEQLILIGDHKQLRPKASEYHLSAESGQGYELNISMFESLTAYRARQFVTESGGRLDYETSRLTIGRGMHRRGWVSTLDTQRRMRPSISHLIRTTLYPALVNGPNVLDYPDVKGFAKNLYFFDHCFKEASGNSLSTSKTNPKEADMVIQMIRHVVRQGYRASEIAVLTPYVGQLLLLRKRLSRIHVTVNISENDMKEIIEITPHEALEEEKKMLEEKSKKDSKNERPQRVRAIDSIRLATVDNFQGEEAKVVIISTVRCNPNGSVGFLKISNRVNVMISRAMHGMYILGSSSTINASKKATMFHDIFHSLKSTSNMGTTIPLKCQPHGNITFIKEPKDFEILSPDGGCKELCKARLGCGHACTRYCHPDDPDHSNSVCLEPCKKLLPCDHPCANLCSQICGPCRVQVQISPACGHTRDIPCYQKNGYTCRVLTKVKMPFCGHTEKLECHRAKTVLGYISDLKKSTTHCTNSLKKLTEIGNDLKMNHVIFDCNQRCSRPLPRCFHPCSTDCRKCVKSTWKNLTEEEKSQILLRVAEGSYPALDNLRGDFKFVHHSVHCARKCEREIPECRHVCGRTCGNHPDRKSCPPCGKKCVSFCSGGHSRCRHKCRDPCYLCAEECKWKCICKTPSRKKKNLKKCIVPCGVPCIRLPCDNRCSKLLKCGHQCPTVCGEICPTSLHCRECYIKAKSELKDSKGSVLISFNKQKNIMESKADFYMLTNVEDVDPNESPLVVLGCNHAISISSLDKYLKLDQVYSKDKKGKWNGIKNHPPDMEVNLTCPNCRHPIKNIHRYGRIIKHFQIESNLFKTVRRSIETCRKIDHHLNDCNKALDNSIEEKNPKTVLKDIQGIFTTLKRTVKEEIVASDNDPHSKAMKLELAHLQAFVTDEYPSDSKARDKKAIMRRIKEIKALRSAACKQALGTILERKTKLELLKTRICCLVGEFNPSCHETHSEILRTFGFNTQHDRILGEVNEQKHFLSRLMERKKAVLASLVRWRRVCNDARLTMRLKHIDTFEVQIHLVILNALNQRKGLNRASSVSIDMAERLKTFALTEVREAKRKLNTLLLTSYKSDQKAKLIDMKATLEKVASQVKVPWSTELSREGKIQIMKNLVKSNFYALEGGFGTRIKKCPNNHPYLVGECGGAMEISKCVDCGAQIGGQNHQNAAGNVDVGRFEDAL
ncbi:hypothetical protein AAMO2058_001304500 [Amorphochlora amoebiformis]